MVVVVEIRKVTVRKSVQAFIKFFRMGTEEVQHHQNTAEKMDFFYYITDAPTYPHGHTFNVNHP